MILYFILLTNTVLLSLCAMNIPQESQFIVSSNKCLGQIANIYFTGRPDVTIFATNFKKAGSVLEEVYKSVKHDKTIFNFTSYKVDFFAVRKNYSIVIANTFNDFLSQPKQIEKLSLWNARSNYVFYLFTNNETLIQEFMDLAWYYYIINAIIITPINENSEELQIFSWFPYEEEFCGKNITLKLIDTCKHGIFDKNIYLFPLKVPNNLHRCPVIVHVLIWPPFVLPPDDGIIIDNEYLNIYEGIEVRMIEAIGKASNFKVHFTSSTVPHDWGLATVDGNTTGAIRTLKEKRADIAMGSFGPTTERRMYCDYSVCHLQEKLTWCVPKAQEGPRWKNLLETFTFTSWIAMICVYFSVSVIIWILCYCPPKDTSVFVFASNSLIYNFSAFLGISANTTPNKIAGRIAYFVWLVFGLHFMVAYQAKLIGVLLRPTYEKQISTIEEVLNSGMEYEILPTHRRFYGNTDDWKVAKILREWKSCHDSDACLQRVAYQRDFALCTLQAHADFEALKYRDAEGQPLVYCIPYVTYTSELYMTKGLPLKHRIDKLIYKIRDSGLMFKWRKDIQRTWLYRFKNTEVVAESKEHVLTIAHLQGAFILLVIGNFMSFIIFLTEISFYLINRKETFEKNTKL